MAQLPLPSGRIVTTPHSSNAGTPAPDGGDLINSYFNIIDEHDAQIANLAVATSGLAPGGLSASQLDVQGLAAIPAGNYPFALSTDQGIQAFNGSAAVNANLPYNLVSGAIDFIMQPSGTVGANGALTLNTTNPLLETYDGCYMFFAAGKAYSGSFANWYWVVMSSTSAGTIYDNTYRDGQPMAPTTLVPIVDPGPGAYTQVTGTGIQAVSCSLLANTLGTQGTFEYKARWSNSNSAGNKILGPFFGGSNAIVGGNENATTTQFHDSTTYVTNRGKVNSQRSYISTSTQPGRLSIDTSRNQTCFYATQLAVDTDWIAIHQYQFRVIPVGILETPAPQIMTASSPLILPAGVAALGLTSANLKQYVQPLASDISGYSAGTLDNNTGAFFNAGLYYKSKPPFTPACLSNATKNGRSMLAFKYDAQNTVMSICGQTQNSVANRMGYIDNTKKYAVEWCVALDTNDPDHWPALWLMPQKQKNGNTANYVEKDVDEGGLVLHNNRTYNGSLNSSINWVWNGTTFVANTSNNSQSGSDWGMPIDRTLFNTWLYTFDPSTSIAKWYVNGVLTWTKDESAYAANQAGDFYYVIISVQSRGLHKNYTMYVDHVAIWQ